MKSCTIICTPPPPPDVQMETTFTTCDFGPSLVFYPRPISRPVTLRDRPITAVIQLLFKYETWAKTCMAKRL